MDQEAEETEGLMSGLSVVSHGQDLGRRLYIFAVGPFAELYKTASRRWQIRYHLVGRPPSPTHCFSFCRTVDVQDPER